MSSLLVGGGVMMIEGAFCEESSLFLLLEMRIFAFFP